jgi:hypothetical protein
LRTGFLQEVATVKATNINTSLLLGGFMPPFFFEAALPVNCCRWLFEKAFRSKKKKFD